jgi:hypothetical protein
MPGPNRPAHTGTDRRSKRARPRSAARTTSHTLRGGLSCNGQTIPDTYSGYDEYSLWLVEVDTGLSYFHEEEGGSVRYAISVPTGTYDVYSSFEYESVMAGAIDDYVRLDTCLLVESSSQRLMLRWVGVPSTSSIHAGRAGACSLISTRCHSASVRRLLADHGNS